MFPGGPNPEQLEWLQQQAKIMQDLEPFYRSAHEGLMHNEKAMRQARESAGKQAEWFRAGGHVPSISSAEASRLRLSAEAVLNSAGSRRFIDAIRQASELSEQRLGTDGLAAAWRIAGRRTASSRSFETGLRLAEERIASGRADQVLGEALELAASQKVREAVRQADADEFVRAARGLEEPLTEGVESTDADDGPEAEADFPASEHPRERLLEARYYAFQSMRVIIVCLTTAVVASSSEVDVEALLSAIGGLYVFLEFVDAALSKEEEHES